MTIGETGLLITSIACAGMIVLWMAHPLYSKICGSRGQWMFDGRVVWFVLVWIGLAALLVLVLLLNMGSI